MLVCWVSLFIILCESLNATPNSSLLERRNKFPGLIVTIPMQERLPRIINMPRVDRGILINTLNQMESDQEINSPSPMNIQRTFNKVQNECGSLFCWVLCHNIIYEKWALIFSAMLLHNKCAR